MVAYLDSGVLIAAWKSPDLRPQALRILESPLHQFVASTLTKLELLPKPIFEKRGAERDFYQEYFKSVTEWQPLDEQLGNDAQEFAEWYGLAAMDALHISAAIRLGAEEFYTSEKPGKPMFRVKELAVGSLHSL